MKVEILLFAAAREIAGTGQLRMVCDTGSTIADLRGQMMESHPALQTMGDTLLWAVNNVYVSDEYVVRESDEIACFPPVSGG